MVSSYNLRSRVRKHASSRSFIVDGQKAKVPDSVLRRGWDPCSLLRAHVPEKEFEVKQSSVPGAGLGVFSKRNIAKGKRVLEYKGQFLHVNSNSDTTLTDLAKVTEPGSAKEASSDSNNSIENENDAHAEHKYCFELEGLEDVCLCAILPSAKLKTNEDFQNPQDVSIAGRVNDLDFDFKRKRYRKHYRGLSCKNNLDWEITPNQQVFLVSTKAIHKGEELGICYGTGYWKRTR